MAVYKERTYKGWTITGKNVYGLWTASTILNGYYKELKADTLQGLKEFITHTINSSK